MESNTNTRRVNFTSTLLRSQLRQIYQMATNKNVVKDIPTNLCLVTEKKKGAYHCKREQLACHFLSGLLQIQIITMALPQVLKSVYRPTWLTRPLRNSGFDSMKRLGVSLPPWTRCESIAVTPAAFFLFKLYHFRFVGFKLNRE